MPDTSPDNNRALAFDELIARETAAHSRQHLRIAFIGVVGILISVAVGFGYQHFSAPVIGHRPFQESAPKSEPGPSAIEMDAVREAFKQLLGEFGDHWQPYLENTALRAWQPDSVHRLVRAREQAIGSFAGGEYQQAQTQLVQLQEDLSALVTQWDTAFDEQLHQARSAFARDDSQAATLALNRALDIKPDSPEARLLQQRLASFADVQQWLKAYQVAVVENDLIKQIHWLKLVVASDPQRTHIAKRLADLQSQHRDIELSRLVQAGLSAIDKGHIAQAQHFYRQAGDIDSGREAVKLLARRIDERQRQEQLATSHSELQRLASQDAWSDVVEKGRAALTLTPGDEILLSLVNDGNAVMVAKQAIEIYNRRPERLADPGIQKKANTALDAATPHLDKSPSLNAAARLLSGHIDTFSALIPLTLSSDNNTEITVLGQGHVGRLRHKIVELAPGTYTLEGRRKGYVSKQLTVTLAPGQSQAHLTLVCNERI